MCAAPTCPNPAVYRGRCATHQREHNRRTHRHREVYNSKKWRITRDRFLFWNPICECGQIATDVHHHVDLDDGGDPWDEANLRALCHPCHSTETRRRQTA
jgi:5-methylcytosine-specific restriction protein A